MKRALSIWKSFLSRTNGNQLRKRRRARSSGVGRGRRSRIESLEERLALTWNSDTLIDNGHVDRRIDMVYVGDGFKASDSNYNNTIDYYADQMDIITAQFFAAAPFDAYASYFNVHRVDVVSNEAGIDLTATNDLYDTALDGYYSDTSDNKLAANPNKVQLAAEDAPDADLLQVVLNGSGRANAGLGNYKSHLSINNSVRTHLHEVGHSLGKLFDEYFDLNNNVPYSGPEPDHVNLTTYSEQDMIANEVKWYRWLGEYSYPEDPDPNKRIGLVPGGGGDHGPNSGIYRPSENSVMRTGTEFDVVGREALIIEMYKHEDISTIDLATPAGEYHYGHEFFVTPMEPATHDLDVQWYLDDVAIPGATNLTLDTSTLSLTPSGEYSIKVVVVDNTGMVRDEGARAAYLTDSMEWTLSPILKVTTGVDENGTNDSALSLREALALAANNTSYPGSDEIIFAPWVSEVMLTDELIISSDVEIIGNGANALTIDAQNNDRAFAVTSGKTATIGGVTITGGLVTGAGDGGGIRNYGNLTLEGVVITESFAGDTGGGIYNSGTLTLDDVVISRNEAGNAGGGIFNAGTLTIIGSSIEDNNAVKGGGIFSTHAAQLNVSGSSFISNDATAGYGGGAYIYSVGGPASTASFSNTTFSGNTSSVSGGAITVSGASSVTLVNSTITLNVTHNNSGGIWQNPAYASVVTLHNTIVVGNLAGNSTNKNFYGNIDGASSHNLVGPGNAGGLTSGVSGNIVLGSGQSAGLKSLDYYGSRTKIHPLEASSPAIDKGSDTAAASLSFDQRGGSRFVDSSPADGVGGYVDIGAVEFAVPKVLNVIMSSTAENPYGSNPPFEFAGVVGDEGQFLSVPVGGRIRQISIQFNKDVDAASEDLEVIPLNVVADEFSAILIESPSIDNSYTATWSVNNMATYGMLADGQYLLRLHDTLTDLEGNKLDGEWNNPVQPDWTDYFSNGPSQTSSEFPSGDNVAGGDFEFVFVYLTGDANRDLIVDIVDLNRLLVNYNQVNVSWDQGDVNGDGVTNYLDQIGLVANYQANFRLLSIIGDTDSDQDVDGVDEAAFLDLHQNQDMAADLNGDSVVDANDLDAFYERLGIALNV